MTRSFASVYGGLPANPQSTELPAVGRTVVDKVRWGDNPGAVERLTRSR